MSTTKHAPVGTFKKAAPWGIVDEPYFAEFEHFGAKFCVHDPQSDAWDFHTSHVDTGFAVPRSGAPTIELAIERARVMLDEVGEEKFKAAVVKASTILKEHGHA